jgi:hypothetical protein
VNFMSAPRRGLATGPGQRISGSRVQLTVRNRRQPDRRPAPDQPAAAAPAPAPPAVTAETTDPDLLAAAELGWCMAELYADVLAGIPQDPAGQRDLEPDLPGLGALSPSQRLALKLDEVRVGAHQVSPRIAAAGLAVPAPGGWLTGTGPPAGQDELARLVLRYHEELLVALTACDRQLGLAYGLGRAMADLSLRFCATPPRPKTAVPPPPEAADADEETPQQRLTKDLHGGRVETITGWLKELHTALPPHVAGALIGSLRQWKEWAQQPVWQGAPLDWSAHGQGVVDALEVQGKRWRLLLTGRADPLDQLSPDDYVQAAGFFVGRVRLILRQLIVQYWPWMALATLAMIAAVVGSLALLESPAAKGIGVAVSVFGWLGLTGRSLWGALRRTVSHVESSLWQAELDLAAAWANTTLPDADADRELREAAPPGATLLSHRSGPRAGQPSGTGAPAARRRSWIFRTRRNPLTPVR